MGGTPEDDVQRRAWRKATGKRQRGRRSVAEGAGDGEAEEEEV